MIRLGIRGTLYSRRKPLMLFLSVLCFILAYPECAGAASAVEPLSKAGQYIVRSGDSLYKIGKNYGVTTEELRRANRLKTDIIVPGQILLVRSGYIRYTVKKGDTLYKIGLNYGASVSELKAVNNISSNIIIPGQVLKIPVKKARPLNEILNEMGVYYGGSRMSILVDKYDRILSLYADNVWLKSYPIELGDGGLADKATAGDHRTPEGSFYICQKSVLNPPQEDFGSRWMRLSYPNYEDAERGLKQGLIDNKTYNGIIDSLNKRWTPSQSTKLGGGVGIHGGNSSKMGDDWTWGCIGMYNKDLEEFYDYVDAATKITIQK